MSHIERNSVGATYLHKVEHLDGRRLMLHWWADYLDTLYAKKTTAFDFAKFNNPNK